MRACIPAFVIRRAKRVFSARHYDVICGQSGFTIFFQNFLKKKKKPIEHKIRVLIYSATLTAKFLILRTIQRDIVINVHGSLCKVPVIPVRF